MTLVVPTRCPLSLLPQSGPDILRRAGLGFAGGGGGGGGRPPAESTVPRACCAFSDSNETGSGPLISLT